MSIFVKQILSRPFFRHPAAPPETAFFCRLALLKKKKKVILLRMAPGRLTSDILYSGYVRKYYDVKNRAFLRNFMRDFCHFYAQFLFFNPSKYIKCENRAFSMENMRVFLIKCVKSRIARP